PQAATHRSDERASALRTVMPGYLGLLRRRAQRRVVWAAMSPVVVRTLPADHITPVRAYAALRAQSPGRSSFMFESAVSGERWGRHAILGYRARSESLLPSGFDPFATLTDGLAQPAAPDAPREL